MMSSGKTFEVTDVGIYTLLFSPVELSSREVGFIAASIKNVKDTRVGIQLLKKIDLPQSLFPAIKKLLQWFIVGYIQLKLINTKICGMLWKNSS